MVICYWFQFQVSSFRFQVSGFRFQVSGFPRKLSKSAFRFAKLPTAAATATTLFIHFSLLKCLRVYVLLCLRVLVKFVNRNS